MLHTKRQRQSLVFCLLLALALLLLVLPLGGSRLLGARALSARDWQALPAGAPAQAPLCWNDEPLPCDGGIYRLSQPLEGGWSGRLSSSEGSLSLCASQWQDKPALLRQGTVLELAAGRGDRVTRYRVQLSGLPILHLRGTEPVPKDDPLDHSPGVDQSEGEMSLFWPEGGKQAVVTGSLNWSLRGRSTYWAPKHNYRLGLTDGHGKKCDRSLLGLRTDDDWLLYSLNSDPTASREMTCAALWHELVQQEDHDPDCIHMKYVELYINNSYRGLYGLATPVDSKSLSLGEGGHLYKWRGSYLPEGSELTAMARWDGTAYGTNEGVRLLYPRSPVPGDWVPLQQYARAFLLEEASDWDSVQPLIDLDNQLDAALFQQYACLTDNFLANRMYVQFEEGGPLYRLPWDLDNSFGSMSGSLDWVNVKNRVLPDHELDTLWRLDPAGMTERIARRWGELRATVFDLDHTLSLLRQCEDLLQRSGAWDREYALWGDRNGALSQTNLTTDLDGLEDFMRDRLELLDDYMSHYEPPERLWPYFMEGDS